MTTLQTMLVEVFQNKYAQKFPHNFVPASMKEYFKDNIFEKTPEVIIDNRHMILNPEFRIEYNIMKYNFIRQCTKILVDAISTRVDI